MVVMRLDPKKEKRDIRTVFLILCAIFSFLSWRHFPSLSSYALLGLVFTLLPFIALYPILLRPVFKLWLKVAKTIGWFNTQVILTLLFILIFIPVGLFMRLFRKDQMRRNLLVDEETYWEPYEQGGFQDRNRYERHF
ncbi:MAG: hypothetical protein D8M57_00085 [Candidatus Scalindua sp. AMX11]|nr:MAG: hypothetical protein DWQ00_18900 [Candidatus Scalindua sp.]TDE66824.1 MAG: hypothetical protein D8M57_00085 [Candidatus Scalindua sp. AMX11]